MNTLPPCRTVRDALTPWDTPENPSIQHTFHPPTEKMLPRIHNLQPGHGPWEYDSWMRLPADKPAPTVRASEGGRFIHPWLDRLLSIRETAVLQDFPDTYWFCGTPKEIHRQIGNSVPVGLARAVGRACLRMLAGADQPVECSPAADAPGTQVAEVAITTSAPTEIVSLPLAHLSTNVAKKGKRVLASLIRLPYDRCPFATEKCKRICFAKRGNFIWHIPKYEANYEFTKSPNFVEEMTGEICRNPDLAKGKQVAICLHGKGEFYSLEYLTNWREIIERTADIPTVHYFVYTRSWISPEYQAALDAMARDLPRIRINLSVDSDNASKYGMPSRIGDGLITWLAETDADLPPAGAAVDIVFRNTAQKDLPPAESLGGFRVCPNETHLYFSRPGRKAKDEPVRITCSECRLCINRSFAVWDKLKGHYRRDDTPSGSAPVVQLNRDDSHAQVPDQVAS